MHETHATTARDRILAAFATNPAPSLRTFFGRRALRQEKPGMKQINCNYHPGGPAMLDENAFSPSDRTRVSAPCRACRARMARERDAKVKAGTYVPKTRKWAPHAETATTERITPAHFVRIGGYYFAQGTILLADTLQDGKVVLHTTILEIDGETKHPRNKKLLFTRQHAPEEYHATLAYLSAASGAPPADPSVNEQVVMQLAEEAASELANANKQIEELRAKLEKFKAVLAD